MVGKGDQRLSATAIMPPQSPPRNTDGGTDVENAFKVLRRAPLVLLPLVLAVIARVDSTSCAFEETAWWQLLLVACDQQLLSSVDRADGVMRAHLRCLVENNQVKIESFRIQERTHCKRAHHQT